MSQDDAFLDGLRRGEPQAFRHMVAVYQDRVVGLASRFLRDPDGADDVAQDVFLEVWKSAKRFRGESQFSTWIYRIAANKSLDALRHIKRQRRQPGDGQFFLDLATAGPASSPDHDTLHREDEALLKLALANLAPKQRMALSLHKLQGLGQEEAAKVMGLSSMAFQSLVFRARQALEKHLTQLIEAPPGGPAFTGTPGPKNSQRPQPETTPAEA